MVKNRCLLRGKRAFYVSANGNSFIVPGLPINQSAVRALAMYDEYSLLTDSLENLKRVEELSAMQKKYAVDQVIKVADK